MKWEKTKEGYECPAGVGTKIVIKPYRDNVAYGVAVYGFSYEWNFLFVFACLPTLEEAMESARNELWRVCDEIYGNITEAKNNIEEEKEENNG